MVKKLLLEREMIYAKYDKKYLKYFWLKLKLKMMKDVI